MPVSHEFKFVFVHIPKCAGTSIEKALMRYCRLEFADNSSNTPSEELNRADAGLGIRVHRVTRHFTASEIASRIGQEAIRKYYKFAVVRNPFDRLVSFYYFATKNRDVSKLQVRIAHEAADFKEFVRKAAEGASSGHEACQVLFNQMLYLTDDDGNLLVDDLIRFESLDEDFRYVCKRIGLRPGVKSWVKDLLGRPRIRLPHSNRSRPSDSVRFYGDQYDDETRRLVEHHSKADLEQLSYSFEVG